MADITKINLKGTLLNIKDQYAYHNGDLATVATSGSYNDLQDKPSIPAGVTVDQTITQNGTNPVRGSAIYSALATKMQRVVINMEENNGALTFTDGDNNALTHAQVRELLNSPQNYVILNYDDLSYPPSYSTWDDGYWKFERVTMGSDRTITIGWDDGIYLDEIAYTLLKRDYLDYLVPTTRKVNNKPLSSDITLNASDVGAIPTVISTTYANLVTKTTNSQLTAGAWYRITDYTCTTTQTDTRSAGHQFDILVQATSPNTLSEEAKAIRHEGDTYFANANLDAWKIWYCLDNDTQRFAWADATNGKGVIYRMIDEYNNDCPYDFKNIQFKRYKITATTNTSTSLVGRYMSATNSYFSAGCTVDVNDFVWCYTFNGYYASWNQDDKYIDSSNLGSDAIDLSKFNYSSFYDENSSAQGCTGNVIPYYIDGDSTSQPRTSLNNIVMYGWVADVSTLPSNYEDLYGDLIFQMMSTPYSNTFGNNCTHNTFGNGCYANTFGNYCNYNSFGNGCYANSFGNGCQYNTFGNGYNSNTFGNGCIFNAFGNGCIFNTFGNNFQTNTLGESFQNSIFGNNNLNNTFGNSCSSNTFGNNCSNNTFGNNCYSNTLGNECGNNTFSKSYTQYVIVENGNKKITLTSSQTPTSSRPLRNITIAQGINNTNTTKTISHNTLNDTFRTTYVATNSVEVQV